MSEENIQDPQDKFEDFFKTYKDSRNQFTYRQKIQHMSIDDKISLLIDFDDLVKSDPDIAKQVLETPDEVLEQANNALMAMLEVEDREYYDRLKLQDRKAFVRFRNLPSISHLPLRKIRSEHIGLFVMVDGILTRASEVKPRLVEAAFECLRCRHKNFVKQEASQLTKPIVCENATCRRTGPFKLISEESKFEDWQKIRIQEKPEELPPGQLPRALDTILTHDLVDTARPGDRVSIIGVLRSTPEYAGRTKLSVFKTYMECNYIDISEKELEQTEITPEEEEKILKLSRDPKVHQKIINSVAPSIYGYERIKEAIALQQFGGVSKTLPDGMKIRGESNVLLVGDPGIAKSQMLQYASDIAPRGLYTSGKGSTAAGLTAAIVKDDAGGMTLEAGALVLADKGLAAIDEFDKMNPQDRVAIHEAMEQRTVSIAKAGIVATLNARTSILAAANPALGRYNEYRTPAENIKLPVTLLSRFDLIFIITDKPDKDRDKAISDHILSLHRRESKEPPLEPEFLKKYIMYSKRNSQPSLSHDAANKIQDFYLEMRGTGEGVDSAIPITARQLESLVRLTESHAKMALKSDADVDDANAVIELMKSCLKEVGVDRETGKFDIDTIMTGAPKSQRDRVSSLLDVVARLEKEYQGPAPIDEVVRICRDEYQLDEAFIKEAIQRLQNDGTLFEPEPGFIRKV